MFPWLFGFDSLGYRHKCLFPKIFLVETLKKIGFGEIKVQVIKDAKYRPTLKITCVKSFDNTYQFITHFRKELFQNKIININDHVIFSIQEQFIDSLQSKIIRFHKENRNNVLDEILIECCIFNPKFASIFLDICIDNKLIEQNKFNRRNDLIKTLEKINYPSILIHMFKETSVVTDKLCYIIC